MSFKDKDKQREYQRNWAAKRKAQYLIGKICECGKPATEVFEARSDGKKFSWTYSAIQITLKLKDAKLLCEVCYRKTNSDRRSYDSTVHGHAVGKTRTYNSWEAMKNRCLNPNHDKYDYYGGRGITICAAWTSKTGFVTFLRDMGARPEGMTLDRIDPDGHYEPLNCRWADAKTQASNKRNRVSKGSMAA